MRRIICVVLVLAALVLGGCGYSKEDVNRAYERGYEDAKDEYSSKYDSGYESGYESGYDSGYAAAAREYGGNYDSGYEAGKEEGYRAAVKEFNMWNQGFTAKCPNCHITLEIDKVYESIEDWYW